MELLKSKSEKLQGTSSSFTNVLRMLCKQKESIANNYKSENERLHRLLIKQQNLLNQLNADNMKLNQENVELKSRNNLNKSSMKHTVILSKEELIEQNKSLKEQLLVSQNYGAGLLRELNEARHKVKQAVKRDKKSIKIKTDKKTDF